VDREKNFALFAQLESEGRFEKFANCTTMQDCGELLATDMYELMYKGEYGGSITADWMLTKHQHLIEYNKMHGR
jgi:hypothetical protein